MKLYFILFLFIIIILCSFKKKYETYQNYNKNNINLVFSINVYRNHNNLIHKQLNNIEQYVKIPYIVILNSSDDLYKELIEDNILKNDSKIFINNDHSNKQRFTGSILRGIIMNMRWILSNFTFDYFIILSQRTFFYNIFDEKIITKLKNGNYPEPNNDWFRDDFKNTKLYKFLESNNNVDLKISSSPHEGILLTQKMVIFIDNFLKQHRDIEKDIYNYKNCVEEFAIQTLLKTYNFNYNLISIPTVYSTSIEDLYIQKNKDYLIYKVNY